MTVDAFAEEISVRFGDVKRARGPYLYTANNCRLTDLYLENGRALLGWGAGSAGTMLKNVLNRGISGSYITGTERLLDRAVSELFLTPRKAFVFTDFQEAEKFAESAGKSFSVFVPWRNENLSFDSSNALIFKPVFPWYSDLWIVAADCNTSAGKKLPAPLTAAITRSIYDLIKALQERSEKDWFKFDKILCKYWERKGPYLISKIPDEIYDKFVLHCLDLNLIINPEKEGESVVPYGVVDSTFDCLKKNEFNW